MTELSSIDWISVAVMFLIILKMLEMGYHKRLVKSDVPDAWKLLPITALIGRVPPLHWILFRLPTQVTVLSILGFCVRHYIISWLVAGLIVCVLWFLIGRMMYDLLYAGTNRYISSLGAPNLSKVSQPTLSGRQRIQSFVQSLIAFVSMTVFGYAAVYHICYIQFNRTAFTGIPDDGYEFFYFIYYSLVTFGTVGYGDVYPAGLLTTPVCDSPFVRILTRTFVGSEICLSFLVVAVFIASFSLAFDYDANSE
jgi:hypothetical protein